MASKNYGTLQDNAGNIIIPGVIETVTNSNGTALKFANGTMICYQRYQVTVSAWYPWGDQLYTGVPTILPKDFPVAFIEIPTVVQYLEGIDQNGWLATRNENTSTVSKTRPGAIQVVRGTTGSANVRFMIDIIAIGRWK